MLFQGNIGPKPEGTMAAGAPVELRASRVWPQYGKRCYL